MPLGFGRPYKTEEPGFRSAMPWNPEQREPIMFLSNWSSLWRILVVGTFAYAAMIIFLRLSGKRTLSKMNAFDMIVTVALGSTLASALLDKNVVLLDGLLAFAVLIGLQFTITWLSVRSSTFSRLIKAEPTLLFYKGGFLREAMKRERVIEDEILAAVRDRGIENLADVEAVVFETEGALTVVRVSETSGQSALQNVTGFSRVNPGPLRPDSADHSDHT